MWFSVPYRFRVSGCAVWELCSPSKEDDLEAWDIHEPKTSRVRVHRPAKTDHSSRNQLESSKAYSIPLYDTRTPSFS